MQLNLYQKLSFLNQLTHNMTRDCSLTYMKNTSSEHVVYKYCFEWQNKKKLYTTCSELVFFLWFKTAMDGLEMDWDDLRRLEARLWGQLVMWKWMGLNWWEIDERRVRNGWEMGMRLTWWYPCFILFEKNLLWLANNNKPITKTAYFVFAVNKCIR